MFRLFTFIGLMLGSAYVSLSWLHDGELDQAIAPVVQSLDNHFMSPQTGP